MTQKITPMLRCNHNANQVATRYTSIFLHSRITSTNDRVTAFTIEGYEMTALNGGTEFSINPSVSFFVVYDSKEEIQELWDKLNDNAKVLMPLQARPRSQSYGRIQDQYGVSRQLMLETAKPISQIITPNFMFTGSNSGKAKEAIKFYTDTFRDTAINQIEVYTEGDMDTVGNVKYSQFTLENLKFGAMDSGMTHGFSFTEGISFVVNCDGQEEVDYFWNKLIGDGGAESQCGWLKDKYGVSWQITPHQLIDAIFKAETPEKGQYAMNQMMKMKKIVIKDLYE